MTQKETISTSRLLDAVLVAPSEGLAALPPLHGEPSPIVGRAKEQHGILVRTLTDYGVTVHAQHVHDESGYATLVGDTAFVLERGAYLMRPSRIERRRETGVIEQKLVELGIPIAGKIDAPGLLDGGDVVIAGGTAYVGVSARGQRSNAIGREALSSLLASAGLRTRELKLAADVPRLNSVFSAIDEDLVVAAPDYVDCTDLGQNVRVIEIPRGEQYGAGVLAIAPRRVIANLRFRVAVPLLRKAKVDVAAIDLWEFGKIGAGPASLVLPAKRA